MAELHIVADYVEIEVSASDIGGNSTKFKAGFKILSQKTRNRLLKILKKADYYTQRNILRSNIVYLADVADTFGNLTNSFQNAIIDSVLNSYPYFIRLFGTFVSLLDVDINLIAQRQNNLYDIGKWQYLQDYPPEKQGTADTLKLQKELGDIMNFEDAPTLKKDIVISSLPTLLFYSNRHAYTIFNIGKYHINEWGQLHPMVLIELAKEYNTSVSDVLQYIPILQAGYNSMKPETER